MSSTGGQKLILDLSSHFTEDDGETSDYLGEASVLSSTGKILKTFTEPAGSSDRSMNLSALEEAVHFIIESQGVKDPGPEREPDHMGLVKRREFDDKIEEFVDQLMEVMVSGLKSEITFDGKNFKSKVLEDKSKENVLWTGDEDEAE